MKTLIAGANGFVCFNLCRELARRGHRLILTDRSPMPEAYRLLLQKQGADFVFIQGNLLERATLEALAEHDFEGIVNGAVITSPEGDEKDFFLPMARINLNSHINLVELAVDKQVGRFLYLSSAALYGALSQPGTAVPEDGALDLLSTYCVSKLACEGMTERLNTLLGCGAVSARISSPYGPFERDTGDRTAMSPIYTLVHHAARGRGELKLYGRDVVRDWTYIGDTVAGLCDLYEAGRYQYGVYNVACDKEVSFLQIAAAVKAAFPGFAYRFVDDPGEADVLIYAEDQRGRLDISRLREDTGFAPAYGIAAGVGEYAEQISLEP